MLRFCDLQCRTAARPASAATPNWRRCHSREAHAPAHLRLRHGFCCAGGELTWHTFAPTTPPSVARTRSSRRTGLCGVNPTGTSSAYLSRSTQTTRGPKRCALGGRPTHRGAPHDRDQRPGRAEEGGELPFGYDARGWLDTQAVKVSQVKLMQRTVKPPPWPRQTTDGPTGLTRCRKPRSMNPQGAEAFSGFVRASGRLGEPRCGRRSGRAGRRLSGRQAEMSR
jgi:hypothetical protein